MGSRRSWTSCRDRATLRMAFLTAPSKRDTARTGLPRWAKRLIVFKPVRVARKGKRIKKAAIRARRLGLPKEDLEHYIEQFQECRPARSLTIREIAGGFKVTETEALRLFPKEDRVEGRLVVPYKRGGKVRRWTSEGPFFVLTAESSTDRPFV